MTEHHDISVVPTRILHLMACAELQQVILWETYNIAKVLQEESLMNNGEGSVLFMSCVDTDTVAALLIGLRLSWGVAFFPQIFINQ